MLEKFLRVRIHGGGSCAIIPLRSCALELILSCVHSESSQKMPRFSCPTASHVMLLVEC